MRKGAAEPVRVVLSSAIGITSTFADVAYLKSCQIKSDGFFDFYCSGI